MLDSSGLSCLTLSAGMADEYAAAASYVRIDNQLADEGGACEQALQLHVHDHVLPASCQTLQSMLFDGLSSEHCYSSLAVLASNGQSEEQSALVIVQR